MPFQKATKQDARLRMLIAGPSKSGKTYTALTVGTRIAEVRGGRIALVDTEHGSAIKYAHLFDFDTQNIDAPFAVKRFVALLHEAEAAGYAVVVIDSIAHAWMGEGGLLDELDTIAQRQAAKSGRAPDSFSAWKEAGKVQNSLMRAIVESPCDVICTVRSKQKYVLVADDKGRKTPEKRGVEPQQREGVEYEFDLSLNLDIDHTGVLEGRAPSLDGMVIRKPGKELADALLAELLGDGTGTSVPPAQPEPGSRTPRPQAKQPATLAGLPTVAGPHVVDSLPSLVDLVQEVRVVGWNVSGDEWADRAPRAARWASNKRTSQITDLTIPELQALLGILVRELPADTDISQLPAPPEPPDMADDMGYEP